MVTLIVSGILLGLFICTRPAAKPEVPSTPRWDRSEWEGGAEGVFRIPASRSKYLNDKFVESEPYDVLLVRFKLAHPDLRVVTSTPIVNSRYGVSYTDHIVVTTEARGQ